jgi:tetratricopeptide (TPR) repeat protein
MSYGKTGQVDRELQTYQRLMNFDPPYALFLQGISLYDQGRYEEAKSYLERAVDAQSSGIPLEDGDLKILQEVLKRYSHEKLGK